MLLMKIVNKNKIVMCVVDENSEQKNMILLPINGNKILENNFFIKLKKK